MRFCLSILCSMAVLAARADEPAIVAKARAYLGTEAALASVRSIHYVGHVVMADVGDPLSEKTLAVDVIFQKPLQYRQMVTSENLVQVIALDDFDGWRRNHDRSDPSKEAVQLLGLDQIKDLRAEVIENLDFYRGLDAEGGSVEDQGPAVADTIPCEKVAFIHNPDVIYIRYFDLGTGRLVLTETGAGLKMRQSGETDVQGIKLPTILTTIKTGRNGREQTRRFVFDRVTVNESFPEHLFAVPPNALPP